MKPKLVRYNGGTSLRSNQNYSTLTVGRVYEVNPDSPSGKYRLQNNNNDFYEYPIELFNEVDGSTRTYVNVIEEPRKQPTVGDKKLALLLKIDAAKEQIKLLEAEVKELEQSPYVLERLRNEGFLFRHSIQAAADLNQSLGISRDNFQIRLGGDYSGKGLYLSEDYIWELITDDHNKHVLLIKAKP